MTLIIPHTREHAQPRQNTHTKIRGRKNHTWMNLHVGESPNETGTGEMVHLYVHFQPSSQTTIHPLPHIINDTRCCDIVLQGTAHPARRSHTHCAVLLPCKRKHFCLCTCVADSRFDSARDLPITTCAAGCCSNARSLFWWSRIALHDLSHRCITGCMCHVAFVL